MEDGTRITDPHPERQQCMKAEAPARTALASPRPITARRRVPPASLALRAFFHSTRRELTQGQVVRSGNVIASFHGCTGRVRRSCHQLPLP